MNGFLNSLGLADHAEDLRQLLGSVESLLTEIRDAVVADPQDRTDRTQRRIYAQGAAPGGAPFPLQVGTVPPGGQWIITRVSLRSNAAAQTARLWLDSVTGGILLTKVAIDADGDFAGDIGESPILTEGRQIWAEFLTAGAGASCRVDVQLDHLQDTPRFNRA